MVQIEGKRLVSWLREHASPTELNMLAGAEFSDDFEEYLIQSSSDNGLVCVELTEKKEKILGFHVLALGTFFVSDKIGAELEEKIRQTQSSFDKNIEDSTVYVNQLGFTASTLGSTIAVVKLAQILKSAEQNPAGISQNHCVNFHEIIEQSDHHNIRVGLKYLISWLVQIEKSYDSQSFYELGLRSKLSSLYRQIGDVRGALKVSNFLEETNRWIGSKTGEQYLRISRAAAQMDGIERQLFDNPPEIFPLIRKHLKVAHAISGGQSTYTLECFNRLNALEKQFGTR